MNKLIELRYLNKNTRIGVEHLGVRYKSNGETVKELNFHHLDGMYSFCTDDDNNIINLRFDTEVLPLGKIKAVAFEITNFKI